MQTKFDVNEVVYIPMTILKISIGYGDRFPTYTLRPTWRGSGEDDVFVSETHVLNKEDIINGKADDDNS